MGEHIRKAVQAAHKEIAKTQARLAAEKQERAEILAEREHDRKEEEAQKLAEE